MNNIVGRWESNDGGMVEFRSDGTFTHFSPFSKRRVAGSYKVREHVNEILVNSPALSGSERWNYKYTRGLYDHKLELEPYGEVSILYFKPI